MLFLLILCLFVLLLPRHSLSDIAKAHIYVDMSLSYIRETVTREEEDEETENEIKQIEDLQIE